jgi:hypothetical protein
VANCAAFKGENTRYLPKRTFKDDRQIVHDEIRTK